MISRIVCDGRTRERRTTSRRLILAAAAGLALGSATPQAAEAADQTFQGPTDPAKAPKDVKLAIVSCSATLKGCQVPSDTAAEVAKGLGWQVAMFDGKANPKSQAAAMLDALAWGASVIIAESIDYHSIQLPLGEAKKRGVAVVAVGQGGDSPNPLPKLEAGQIGWTFAVDVDNLALGHAIGDWIVQDSGGTAHVAVFNDLEFEGVTRQHQGVMESLGKCSGCVALEQQFAASQIATNLGQQVVGFLRSHPDVTYVYAPYDPSAFAMVAAIRQAGMGSRIKLASLLGDEENLDLIRRGQIQVADIAFDLRYAGYAAVDQIIRYLDKQPLSEPHGENVPYEVLTSANLPDRGNWTSPSGYADRFQALWK